VSVCIYTIVHINLLFVISIWQPRTVCVVMCVQLTETRKQKAQKELYGQPLELIRFELKKTGFVFNNQQTKSYFLALKNKCSKLNICLR